VAAEAERSASFEEMKRHLPAKYHHKAIAVWDGDPVGSMTYPYLAMRRLVGDRNAWVLPLGPGVTFDVSLVRALCFDGTKFVNVRASLSDATQTPGWATDGSASGRETSGCVVARTREQLLPLILRERTGQGLAWTMGGGWG
jgi:hypothetical protein